MFQTPILFLIFNRPDTTQRVFEKIKEIKPAKLYIAADGPRAGKDGEEELCNQTRNIVNHIDWNCEVKTLYADQNMGFSKRIKSALNWFFDQVPAGIILEDDCLPSTSFFKYCEIMLKEYQHDENIDLIVGSNFCDKPISKTADYFISDFSYIWGWASWASSIKNITWNERFSLEDIHEKLTKLYNNNTYVGHFITILIDNYITKDCWDVELFVQHIMHNKKSIFPNINLVSNIGNSGTHYNNSKDELLNTKYFEIDFKIFNQKNASELSKNELKYVLNQFNNKANPLNIRDRLYLFRKKLQLF